MAEWLYAGVVLATLDPLAVENGLECVAADCPIPVEIPIDVSFADATALAPTQRR